MNRQLVEYKDGDNVYEGALYYNSELTSAGQKLPLVLVCHAFAGRTKLECSKAETLAEQGYVGFAVDVYGKGVLGRSKDENLALMTPLSDDRSGVLARLLRLAYDTAVVLPMVDAGRVAAIGYCFGGLCVLDMARMGVPLCGVVSIHGDLEALSGADLSAISAKVLALHGHDDPLVPPEQVLAFETEMSSRKADWQLHAYGATGHAFTNPEADKLAIPGVAYKAVADRRAHLATNNFLAEIFDN